MNPLRDVDTTPPTDEALTISAAADALGITVDTIRYYEKEGIAPAPKRGADGWRRYDHAALSWLAGVAMLRGTGMNVKEMKEYAAAYRAGSSEEERLALLEQHHITVIERLAEVNRHLAALEQKIDAYKQAILATLVRQNSPSSGTAMPSHASSTS